LLEGLDPVDKATQNQLSNRLNWENEEVNSNKLFIIPDIEAVDY
jgi:hypothetical protein